MDITVTLFFNGVNTPVEAKLILPQKYEHLPINIISIPVLQCGIDTLTPILATRSNLVGSKAESLIPDNDMYDEFIRDCIHSVRTESGDHDKNAHITLNEMYAEFKRWFCEYFPCDKIPSRPEFRTKLLPKLGGSIDTVWYGVRLGAPAFA